MELDAARIRLLQLVADAETDLATVSRAIGRNHAYLQQFIKMGKPRALPEEAREAIAKHFNITPDELRPGGALQARTGPRDLISISGNEYQLLPVYDLRLSAGPGAWTEGEIEEPVNWEPYRLQWLRSITRASGEGLMVARVDGDSMEPTLRSGDQVLVDRTKRVAGKDGIYAIRRGDELQVKRVSVDPSDGLLTIISDNSAYRNYQNVDPDSLDVIGRVIWLGRTV